MHISQTLQVIIAGLIQGITELLPVSSTGHLLLFSQITGVQLAIAEIAIIHLGTVLALIVVMWDKLPEALQIKNLIKIALAIIPAGIIGFLLQEKIDSYLAIPTIIAASLIFWGIVMIIVDYIKDKKKYTATNLAQISKKQSVIVGIGQVLALIPGTSRSGITTLAGIASGINPQASVDFSFITGIPLIAATGLYSLLKYAIGKDVPTESMGLIIITTIIAFAVGLIAAYIYRKFINKRILTIAGIYRIALGIIVLYLLFV